eukprot:CAMPEP_0175127430 /NCGR_PEP_ID=MMETSP0087-20121206/4381_1 /TAXON_ID=136419 /ORGANISM="Unknown Unknown, Strain D1" /LENGTH=255 /DNA_ID=CAMNT_0016409405 /DNA_START=93 /DNA_END=857 /DNA_ORIENTATION=-
MAKNKRERTDEMFMWREDYVPLLCLLAHHYAPSCSPDQIIKAAMNDFSLDAHGNPGVIFDNFRRTVVQIANAVVGSLSEAKHLSCLYTVYGFLAFPEEGRGMIWKELPTQTRWQLEAVFSREQTDTEHLQEQVEKLRKMREEANTLKGKSVFEITEMALAGKEQENTKTTTEYANDAAAFVEAVKTQNDYMEFMLNQEVEEIVEDETGVDFNPLAVPDQWAEGEADEGDEGDSSSASEYDYMLSESMVGRHRRGN